MHPKSSWCYELKNLDPSFGNLGEDEFGFFCLNFFDCNKTVEIFLLYTYKICHSYEDIVLNEDIIKYSLNECSSNLIDSCTTTMQKVYLVDLRI